ncbi:MAG: 2-dehydropantoate 2-reductase [Eubacteriales bacterium]|nr:2-dehydropantoate 2-reductase [Eubacteriales bacterium]MDD4583824.1 2-dehydropantoate 2-reductase [Eubacteriales bacterium]
MKIAIVGAGAMGCLYGAKLSLIPENQVFLVDVRKDHIDAINENGLLMEEEGIPITYNRVKATSEPRNVGTCDLVILFVKSILTKEAVRSNKEVFGSETVVLTLQNGLGNIEAIATQIQEGNIIAGTTAHGATLLGPGSIKHAGKGKTVIGELSGEKTKRLLMIAQVLNQAGLVTDVSDNVMGLIWDKLLVNVGINPLTGLTGLCNGDLLKYTELEVLLEAAVAEAAEVARAIDIHLHLQDPVAHTKEVCLATASNKSSMLQDLTNNRQTEIEMINGAIVKEGYRVGVPTPVNATLTNLVLFAQKTNKSNA